MKALPHDADAWNDVLTESHWLPQFIWFGMWTALGES